MAAQPWSRISQRAIKVTIALVALAFGYVAVRWTLRPGNTSQISNAAPPQSSEPISQRADNDQYNISITADPISPAALYQRAGYEWEHYDRLIWQTTTLAVTVLGGLLFFAFNEVQDSRGRIIVLLTALFAGIPLRVGLSKHRMFTMTRTAILNNLERDAINKCKIDYMIQRSLPNDVDRYCDRIEARNIVWRFSAYNWLANSLSLALIGIGLVLIFNLGCIAIPFDLFGSNSYFEYFVRGRICGS
jgi:hypothetical protein